MCLKEKIKNLPSSPGVYLMKDSLNHIIYVGKAKNLKNRVSSYFHHSKNHLPKVKKLIQNIKDLELIQTDTEFEAFMLECQLIKELKPIYNKKMKSPHSYSYIVIQNDKRHNRFEISNSPTEEKFAYSFGPYTSQKSVERVIQGIKEHCKIDCSNQLNNHTPCLNYTLGFCIGVCLGEEKREQYQQILSQIIALLNGTDQTILEEMKERMRIASERFNFEVAVKLRDTIEVIQTLIRKEKVIEFTEENHTIALIEKLDEQMIKFFLVKRSTILFREKYHLESKKITELSETLKNILLNSLADHEMNSSSKLSKHEIDQAQIIYSYLSGSNCRYILIPENWLLSENTLQLTEAIYTLLKNS